MLSAVMKFSPFEHMDGKTQASNTDFKSKYEQDLGHFSPALDPLERAEPPGEVTPTSPDGYHEADNPKPSSVLMSRGLSQTSAHDLGGRVALPVSQLAISEAEAPPSTSPRYWKDYPHHAWEPDNNATLMDPYALGVPRTCWPMDAAGRRIGQFWNVDSSWLDLAVSDYPRNPSIPANLYSARLPTMVPRSAGIYPERNNDEVSTIFITGFPDDITEREFNNMFLFSHGFEAATLTYPNRGEEEGKGQNEGAGSKIRQTIGFAKFCTREEAVIARDILNGFRIASEQGCILKAEMAKKNLHIKNSAQLTVKPPIHPFAPSFVHPNIRSCAPMIPGLYEPLYALPYGHEQLFAQYPHYGHSRDRTSSPTEPHLHQDRWNLRQP